MIEWILSSSVLILIVICLRTVFKGRIRLGLQYAMWGLVLVRLLVPLSIGQVKISVANLSTSAVRQPAVQQVLEHRVPHQSYEEAYGQLMEHYESQGVDTQAIPQAQLQQEAQAMTEKPFGEILAQAAKWVWLTGMTVVAGLFVLTNLSFRRKLRSRASLNMTKDGLPVWVCDLDTPCLFGLWKPAIYVTQEAAADEICLRHTLEHELTHYRHRDHLWSVLRGVCLAVHWYNPLVWAAAFFSQRDAELACDEATIRRLGEAERAEYGRTLIGMTCRRRANVLATATTMNASASGIRERILLIARKPKMAVYTLATVLLVAAAAVGCTFTGGREITVEPVQKEEFFGQYGRVLTVTEEVALVWTEGDEPKLTLYRYALQEDSIDILDTLEATVEKEKGISVNHFPLAQGHLYLGTVADRRGVWDTLVFTDTGGQLRSVKLDGLAWFVILENELATFKAESITGAVVEDYAGYLSRKPVYELSFDPLPTRPEYTAPVLTQPTWPRPSKPTEPSAPVQQETEPFIPPENEEYPPLREIDHPTIDALYENYMSSKICIAVWPTGVVNSGDEILYIIPENQEEFLAAWEKALAAEDPEGYRMPGEAYGQWLLVYHGRHYQALADGSYITNGRIAARDAKEIHALCEAAVREAGIPEAVEPADLYGIVSATLRLGDEEVTVTNSEALQAIEYILTNSTPSFSSMCWATGMLTVELKNGETKTVAMFSDSCAGWMSEGKFYQYGKLTPVGASDNLVFYGLFKLEEIHEAAQQGVEKSLQYWNCINWNHYGQVYGQQAALKLMDDYRQWALLSGRSSYEFAVNNTWGLRGEYRKAYGQLLADLFEAAPKEFSRYCLKNSYDAMDALDIEAVNLLAEYWGIDYDSAYQKLNSEMAKY